MDAMNKNDSTKYYHQYTMVRRIIAIENIIDTLFTPFYSNNMNYVKNIENNQCSLVLDC